MWRVWWITGGLVLHFNKVHSFHLTFLLVPSVTIGIKAPSIVIWSCICLEHEVPGINKSRGCIGIDREKISRVKQRWESELGSHGITRCTPQETWRQNGSCFVMDEKVDNGEQCTLMVQTMKNGLTWKWRKNFVKTIRKMVKIRYIYT